MKSSSKTVAALALSMLVFPGTGHFLLGHYKRGLLWVAVFGAVMIGFLGVAAAEVSKLMDAMSPTGDINFDTQKLVICALLGMANFVVWGLAGADTFYLSRRLPAPPSEESSL